VLGGALPYVFLDDVKWGVVVANKLKALLKTPRGYYGMSVAHIGVAFFVMGITVTNLYSTEKDIRLMKGEAYEIQDYKFVFEGVQNATGPNFRASEGWFSVYYQGEQMARLYSQKRLYNAGGMPMTEAGIDAGFWRDLYVSIGEDLDGKGAWSVRLYHKPMIIGWPACGNG